MILRTGTRRYEESVAGPAQLFASPAPQPATPRSLLVVRGFEVLGFLIFFIGQLLPEVNTDNFDNNLVLPECQEVMQDRSQTKSFRPKSAILPDVLWMLELARQRNFRRLLRSHVSANRPPECGCCRHSLNSFASTPFEANRVSAPLGLRGNRASRTTSVTHAALVSSRLAGCLHKGRNSLMGNRLFKRLPALQKLRLRYAVIWVWLFAFW